MPTYSFKNNDTGAEWEEFFSIADKEEFLKENDHITQLPSLISIIVILVVLKMMVGGKIICHGLQKPTQAVHFHTVMVRSLQRI